MVILLMVILYIISLASKLILFTFYRSFSMKAFVSLAVCVFALMFSMETISLYAQCPPPPPCPPLIIDPSNNCPGDEQPWIQTTFTTPITVGGVTCTAQITYCYRFNCPNTAGYPEVFISQICFTSPNPCNIPIGSALMIEATKLVIKDRVNSGDPNFYCNPCPNWSPTWRTYTGTCYRTFTYQGSTIVQSCGTSSFCQRNVEVCCDPQTGVINYRIRPGYPIGTCPADPTNGYNCISVCD